MGQRYRGTRNVARKTLLIGIFLAVWLVAIVTLQHTIVQLRTRNEMESQLRQMEIQRDQNIESYAAMLVEIDQLSNDNTEKVKLLRDNLGYAKDNEIPVFIIYP